MTRVAAVIVFLLAGMASPDSVTAQGQQEHPRSHGELLQSFKRGMADGVPPGDVMFVLTHPETYPSAELNGLLAGLEQLALSTGETPRLREQATVALSLSGARKRPQPVRGIFARLHRIYREADDQVVRSIAVSSMAGLAEEKESVAFLEGLARKAPGDPDFPRAVGWALRALPGAGEEGRAAMKRLHESGAVHDPEGRAQLAEIAKHDYHIGPKR